MNNNKALIALALDQLAAAAISHGRHNFGDALADANQALAYNGWDLDDLGSIENLGEALTWAETELGDPTYREAATRLHEIISEAAGC